MKRITLGRQVVDLSQVDQFEINRKDFSRNAGMAVLAVALGGLAVLTRDVTGLSQTLALSVLGIGALAAVWKVVAMVSAPFVLDVIYKGGRGVRIECISRSHAEDMKADLLKRLAE